jgi:hypothetical protein
MSNKTKTTTSEAQNKLDPRMDAAIYNALLPRMNELLQQPAINSRMREGLDKSYDYYNSPTYSAIFNQLLGQGSGLLGRGVAGNPYSSTRGTFMSFQVPMYDARARATPLRREHIAQVPVLLNSGGLTPEQQEYLQFAMMQDRNARTG